MDPPPKPSTKPDPSSFKTSTSTYISSNPSLPPTTPQGHPHILKNPHLASLSSNIPFVDGLATHLFHTDPAALTALLDVTNEKEFVFHKREKGKSSGVHIFVFRSLDEITAGYATKNPPIWDLRVTYQIVETGKWEPVESYRWLWGRKTQGNQVEEEGRNIASLLLASIGDSAGGDGEGNVSGAECGTGEENEGGAENEDEGSEDEGTLWSVDAQVIKEEWDGIDHTERDESAAFMARLGV